jgi:aryl sulfotransferase
VGRPILAAAVFQAAWEGRLETHAVESFDMATITATWPQKTRELQTVLFDSTRWNGFKFRDDDIVIATWGKAGTTWTQQIVGQLLFRGAEGIAVMDECPWLDLRLFPVSEVMEKLEAQTHRRFIKTHLPLDALVFSPQAKYLYIGRDGRDCAWSWHNHMASMSAAAYEWINGLPGRVGPKAEPPSADVVQYFREWLDSGGFPLADFWQHYQSWWDARHLPNVLLVHFNNLKADLPGEMRRIANFLGIEIEEELWPALVGHCTFEYMKKNAAALSPFLGMAFKGGAGDFVHKGTNGRWRDLLTAADLEKYERVVKERLTPECAHWLATGQGA